jgi:integrase/recombinase XerD
MQFEGNGQARVLDSQQLDHLISCITDQKFQVLAITMRFTAARVSEARQLVWGCIGEEEILLPKNSTKGKLASRVIPVNPLCIGALEEWRHQWAATYKRPPRKTDPVFPGASMDRPVTRQRFGQVLADAAARARLTGVSSHSFRRSALSASSASGTPLADLRTLSGHRSLQTLQVYLQTSDAAKRRAAMRFA